MINGFNISQHEWNVTPSSVRLAALSLNHQLRLLQARFDLHQQQLAALKEEIAESGRQRSELESENERLTKEVAKLKESLGLNSSNSSLPPSSDSSFQKLANNHQPSGRKQGAQPGHEGVGRWLFEAPEIDEAIELRPASCARCGGLKFEPADWFLPARRQVTEITISGTKTIEYQRPALRCSNCGKRSRAAWPEIASDGAFGPRVKAVIGYLTGRLGASHRDTVEAMKELFGVKIGLGSISATQRRISNALARPVAQLQLLVEDQAVVYVDETGWREKERRKWLRVKCSAEATLFQIHDGRSTKNTEAVIGINSQGIVTTDRYPGYNFISTHHRQICWAHLKRDFQAISERSGDSQLIGAGLLEQTKHLFDLWHLVRDGTLRKSDFHRAVESIKQEVSKLLSQGAMVEHSKTRNTCRNILRLESSLWTFTKVENVEPTNNDVERALRRAVIWRRKSFGTQSAMGSRFVERILTVVATLRQQGRGVLEYLTTAGRAAVTTVTIIKNCEKLNLLPSMT